MFSFSSSFYVLLQIGLIFYAICISFNAYHKHPALGDMPRYVRNLVLGKLGKLWGLTKDSEIITRKLDALRNLSLTKDNFSAKLKETKTILRPSKRPASNGHELRKLGIECKRTSKDCLKKQTLSGAIVASKNCGYHDTAVCSETLLFTAPRATSGITHRVVDYRLDLNTSSKTKQSRGKLSTRRKCMELSEIKGSPCTCPSLLQDMVVANERLLSSIRKVVYVASEFDKQSSEKEHWLLTAAILDRFFLILFVLAFIIITLINFLW